MYARENLQIHTPFSICSFAAASVLRQKLTRAVCIQVYGKRLLVKELVMEFLKKAKPYIYIIFLQFGYAGSAIIAKAALNKGMSPYTFAVYRNLFSAVVFASFAVVFERKMRPRMTISVFWKILLLGSLQPVIGLNLYYAGMKYTTATFATAMTNMLPALSFLLAWICRLEHVNVRRLHSQVKIAGTIVTVGGSMIMVLIRGPGIGLPWTIAQSSIQSKTAAANLQDPVKGALMLTASCFCFASFFTLQAITLKSYPAGLSLTSMICMAGTLEAIVLTLVAERGNPSIWSIHFDTILLSYVYCGLMTSGIGYYVSGIIMKEKGPVFVTAFSPLHMVITAIMSTFILAEQLNSGRVFGAIIIVLGLYLVIWGKSKDQISSSESNNIDQRDSKDQQLSETNLTGKSSNDECLDHLQTKQVLLATD